MKKSKRSICDDVFYTLHFYGCDFFLNFLFCELIIKIWTDLSKKKPLLIILLKNIFFFFLQWHTWESTTNASEDKKCSYNQIDVRKLKQELMHGSMKNKLLLLQALRWVNKCINHF